MRKAWKLSALSLCLSLLAASAWVVLNPVSAFAADGKASCGGFTSVRCADGAVRCVCEDYVGCTSHFANGTTSEAKCKDGNGFVMMEESAY
jgi:hypothetical protein